MMSMIMIELRVLITFLATCDDCAVELENSQCDATMVMTMTMLIWVNYTTIFNMMMKCDKL